MSYRLLAAATNHPDPVNPYVGVFNARSIGALADRDVTVDAVVPRPFAPPIGPYSSYRRIPRTSPARGYTVHHPRFLYAIPKRLGYGLTGRSYASRVPAYADRTFDRPDVVHGFHLYPDAYGFSDYCDDRDVPLFATAHGTLLNQFESYSRGVRSKIRATLRACERVLCVSDALEKRVREYCPDADTAVVPIGADPSRFPTDQTDQIRHELDIPDESPVVLFCGHFSRQKGVDDLIETLPTLAETDAHYFFTGRDGDRRVPLETAIVDAGLADRATVMCDVPPLALRRLFAVADVFVLPSHSEGRPTVIYEAMAARTAVLATSVGGVPEQVTDGETGVVIPPGEPDALAHELELLCADPGQRETFATAGLERLRDHGWTWTDHAARLDRHYREAIDR
ncbi:glycosyltransferase [Natrarchaeobaculum aegyptiacum]|uniref:Glycosyl transferase family 1 n=1 Tax=Natrarchaeobaculum aegyptiacum TaxID=745377 RepID=A0A2Z2HWJ3_9EURY|nr:glycosyltransferase [Natrarchaeobaculum aegyptiacum]ARS89977.1 hypothetical protein B1756_09705 [Natrarchaeobaculum aegyptiacum]